MPEKYSKIKSLNSCLHRIQIEYKKTHFFFLIAFIYLIHNTRECHRFVMWCDKFDGAKGSRSYEIRVPNLEPRWTDEPNLEPLKEQIYDMKHEISMLKQDTTIREQKLQNFIHTVYVLIVVVIVLIIRK